MLWFFADFTDDSFFEEEHTRVLFDLHGNVAGEREAPADLPSLHQRQYGWLETGHPRAFVEPKAGLSFHLFDTFYDRPYEEDDLGGSVAYFEMIDELREEALERAIGMRRTRPGYWFDDRSGFGEPHWPATSVDAEYALMSLGRDARSEEPIRSLRERGPLELAPAERVAIRGLIEQIRGDGSDVRFEINNSYPHAAFEILGTMPEPGEYVASEMLHPYQELTVGHQVFFHQMFGHGSSSQGAPQMYEHQDCVLLLQIGGSDTLGFLLSGDAATHYWIRKRDLAAGRFDRIEATWEAG